MSKPRYKWWGYVKWVIRDYPTKCAELAAMQTQKITPAYNSQPHGGEATRTTESIALRSFTGQKLREYDAVRSAIAETDTEKMKVVYAVLIAQTHTISGAAQLCNVSEITAIRYHGEFIRRVAKHMGLLD